MNLDFGILWIEDSYSPDEEESLKRRVREAGFLPRIEVIPNGTNIEELANEHAKFHIYDLILLDYRLKNENGDELAPRVRRLFPSTTILFYSGSLSEDQLRALIAAKSVDGVYCAPRDHRQFIQRTGELIDQTARALDRLSGMRGLAMRVVAECDGLMKDAMCSMYTRDARCAELSPKMDADVFTHLDDLKTRYTDATAVDFDARLKTRAIDSAKLFQHFRRLTQFAAGNPEKFELTEEQVERLRELRKNSAQYIQKVLEKRNILGHVVELRTEDGWALRGTDEIKVSDFAEIRKTFAGHIDSIREIGKLITHRDE